MKSRESGGRIASLASGVGGVLEHLSFDAFAPPPDKPSPDSTGCSGGASLAPMPLPDSSYGIRLIASACVRQRESRFAAAEPLRRPPPENRNSSPKLRATRAPPAPEPSGSRPSEKDPLPGGSFMNNPGYVSDMSREWAGCLCEGAGFRADMILSTQPRITGRVRCALCRHTGRGFQEAERSRPFADGLRGAR
ncbi:hypothetical protein BH20ACT10_BH20ACT10_06420 [soil metagenome]